MNELIERKATIDAVNNAFDRETLLTGFVRSIALRVIRDMPSVQPELQWIPCENDLPDIGMTVLFCDIDGDEFIGHRALHWWWSVDEKVKNVIAWMPLPEPYTK